MSFVYKLPSPTRSQTQAMVQSQNQGFCHEQLDSFRWDRILTSTTINSGYSQRNRSTNKSTCGKAVLRSGNLHLVITIISSQIPMRREKAWTWKNTSTIRRERRLLGGATLLLKITQKPHMRRYTYMIWSWCNVSIVSCLWAHHLDPNSPLDIETGLQRFKTIAVPSSWPVRRVQLWQLLDQRYRARRWWWWSLAPSPCQGIKLR